MRPRSFPLLRSRCCLISSGMLHGCSITSRYMSQTWSVPSGALAKLTTRTQVSVLAANSKLCSSAGEADAARRHDLAVDELSAGVAREGVVHELGAVGVTAKNRRARRPGEV